jgi:hypothetical protein
MEFVAHFFVGAFLFNAIPHLAAGLQGAPFQTPFARPRGVGESSALANVIWGSFNLIAGLLLIAHFPIVIGFNLGFGLAIVGALALGSYVALHFERVRTIR